MASILGRLQRLLRPTRPHRTSRRDHSDNLGTLLRCLRAHLRTGSRNQRRTNRPGRLPFPSQHNHCRPTCYLQDLFTSQPARGKGVGKALIKGVYDEAKNTGSARRLYDQVAENACFIVYRNHEWTQMHAN
jgi:GNAT superfamily N-acetyltransferase